MPIHLRNSTWKEAAALYVRSNSLWKAVSAAYLRVNGVWREIFGAGTPAISTKVTLTRTRDNSTYLYTLTGTNYHWTGTPTSLDFAIQRSIDSQATWADISYGTITNPSTGSSVTKTYELRNITNDLAPNVINYYRFVVNATKGALTGTSTSNITADTTIQGPTDIVLTGSSGLQATLSWTASTGASNYLVFYGTTSNPTTFYGVQSTTSLSYSGTLGTTYYWKVIPITGISNTVRGYTGNDSNIVSTTITSKLATPIAGTVTQTLDGFYFAITSGSFSTSNNYSVTTNAGTLSTSGWSAGQYASSPTITISGLSAGASATVSVVASRAGYTNSDALQVTSTTAQHIYPVINSFSYSLGSASGTQDITFNWDSTNQNSWSILIEKQNNTIPATWSVTNLGTQSGSSQKTTTVTGQLNTTYRATLTVTSVTNDSVSNGPIQFSTQSGAAPVLISGQSPVATVDGSGLDRTMNSTTGGWQNSPTSYSYSWSMSIDGSTYTDNIATGSSVSILPYYSTYRYAKCYVTASNSFGSSSAAVSNSVTLPLPPTSLSTPGNVAATALTSTSIRISWSAVSGATGYEIYRSTTNTSPTSGSTATYTTSSLSYDDLNLNNSTRYYYSVRATDGTNYSNWSTLVDSLPLQNPPSNTALPVISNAVVGSVTTTTDGTWANSPTSYSYSWQVFVLGDYYQFETSKSFTMQSSYNVPVAGTTSMSGKTIVVTVAATNNAGTTYADSASVIVSTSTPPYFATPPFFPPFFPPHFPPFFPPHFPPFFPPYFPTPTTVTVPNVLGMLEANAVSAIQSAGLNASVSYDYNGNAFNDGTVKSQSPSGGSQVSSGFTVAIVVWIY